MQRVPYFSLREYWQGFTGGSFEEGIFVVFRGYIDESYDGQRKLFSLSCLVASGEDWERMESAWRFELDAVNEKLRREGRPEIWRYHAADCSSRRGEFEGWSHAERDCFVLRLFEIFKRIPVHAVGYDLDLDYLCEVFPEWADDRLGAGYNLLTTWLLYTIGDDFESHALDKPINIALVHDRTSGHDATILRAFQRLVLDSAFPYRSYFTTISAWSWHHCIALQPADLVAFEVFKDAERRRAARDPRKSFDALLNLESFGIHTKTVTKPLLLELRKRMEQDKALKAD